MRLTIYFDFVCPFTNRLHSFLELVKEEKDLTIEWKPFVLGEQNRSSEQPLWEQDAIAEHAEVMSLAGLEAAKDQEKDVDTYVNEMFMLWHIGETPDIDAVRELHKKYGLQNIDEYIDSVIVSHGEGRNLGVFGSPTVIVEKAEKPLFIKLDHVPEEAGKSFDQMVQIARNPGIEELKKATKA